MDIAETLKEIHDNVQSVYDAGYKNGHTDGYQEGQDAGILNERTRFWNIYQDYGQRTNYSNAFYMYTEDIFQPLHDMNCVGSAQNMFAQWKTRCDMVELLNRLDIKFITAGITNYTQTFSSAMFTRIGTIDCSNVTTSNGMYGIFATWTEPVLEQIDSIIVSETTPFNNCFYRQSKLKEIRFDTSKGYISQNGLSLQYSTELSKESIISIINALARNEDEEGNVTPTGLTVTLSQKAVNDAFETAKGNADGSTSEEWAALIATKQNWTISLV